ncbi:MAG: Beta-mannosidase B [Trichoglossum hirsutum]|nr:MAG: Beta-mannosidase B [Trichoglossum hirsutum]
MAKRIVKPLDQNWEFKQVDGEASAYLPVAQLPTNIHLDLMANGLIPDPFFAKNERDVQWVGEKAWKYRTTFAFAFGGSEQEKVVLAFGGLDTYAKVVLNGVEILRTDNMFIPERVEVSEFLVEEEGRKNELEITFESAFLVGKRIPEMHPKHHWGCWNGDPSRLAGWDWGPTLLTCGPWRPINLEVYQSRIADLYFTTTVKKSLKSAEMVVKADIEGSAAIVKFDILLKDRVISTETVEVSRGTATATFLTHNPELWYPAGYGMQPLYTLTARLLAGNEEVDVDSKRFGLRRVNVVQRKLADAPGMTFFFEINNIPIFCGGSNWIPADSFTPRISKEKYRDWVKLAVDGNQRMIRVWGGGIFEEQVFYDACDEMGLLVWQDFLFGCGNYPAYPEFLKSVKREATANVKLLRHHPSIVIYAGNNEDYQYQEAENLDYDPKDHDPQSWLKSSFPARYIYEKLLADVTKELVPGTYYHFGSPWGGKNTRDATVGDIHQWNVWHGTQERYQDFDKLVGRFVSEFGMESFPNIRTIDSYLPEGSTERYPQSSTIDFHNKAANHEGRLALYLVENIQYKFDPIEQFIYCTQLMQSECLSSAYRLWKRQWKGFGREYCAGALVWQLNDCWPVTSWAIADYYLRPKYSYYAIKRELAPLTIGLKRTTITTFPPNDKYSRIPLTVSHKISMWATNLSIQCRSVSVSIRAFDIASGAEIYHAVVQENFSLPPNCSTEVMEFDVPVQGHYQDEDAHMKIVVAAYLHDMSSGERLARYINWPDPLKYVPLQHPKNLQLRIAPDAQGVEVSAEVPVKGVALEVVDWKGAEPVWEDNCVDIVPGETVVLGVRGLKAGEEERVMARYLGL